MRFALIMLLILIHSNVMSSTPSNLDIFNGIGVVTSLAVVGFQLQLTINSTNVFSLECITVCHHAHC